MREVLGQCKEAKGVMENAEEEVNELLTSVFTTEGVGQGPMAGLSPENRVKKNGLRMRFLSVLTN